MISKSNKDSPCTNSLLEKLNKFQVQFIRMVHKSEQKSVKINTTHMLFTQK